jgi:hypothetical protein
MSGRTSGREAPGAMARLEQDGCPRNAVPAGQVKFLQRDWTEYDNPFAPIEALLCCTLSGVPVPDWVTDGVCQLFAEALDAGLRSTGGRNARPLQRAATEWAHYERFCAVSHVRYVMTGKSPPHMGWSTDAEQFNRQQQEQSLFRLYGKEAIHLGDSWDDAYESASYLLEGSNSAGQASSMKRSYEHFVSRQGFPDFERLLPGGYTAVALGLKTFQR